MTPLRSIVMWGAAICAVLFMLFLGHSLAIHEIGPLITAFVLLVISVVLLFVQTKLARDEMGRG